MSIGILTFINTINYGALLQAYALEKAVEDLGKNVEIINYTCPAIAEREIPSLPSIPDFSNPKTVTRKIFTYPVLSKRAKRFKEFQDRYMIMEPELFDGGKTIKKYNTIIVGSDQVWNLKITNDDHTYFLEGDRFSKINHKVAYAASFGDEGPSRVLESDLLLRLHEFSFVGLREKGAERALNEAGITNTHVVVDPTLLIETTDWENLADVQHVQKEPYLFAYIVSNFNETIGYAKRLANEMGLKLVVLHCAANRPLFGVSSVNDASPRQFLGLIKNAAFVVTSSFHGMCFSLLFHKQFRYLSNQEKTSTVSRMDSLAMALGVESASAQYVGKPAAFDYEEIEARLSSIRSDSVRYLSSALNE